MYSGLYNYLESCPQLQGQAFHFDFITANPVAYTVSFPVNEPVLSNDVVGNSKNQLNFALTAIENWGDDIDNNVAKLEFFQKVKRWFEKQNRNKIFPDMGSDKIVTGVYATTDGFIEATEGKAGRYQMLCKAEYQQLDITPSKIPLIFYEN